MIDKQIELFKIDIFVKHLHRKWWYSITDKEKLLIDKYFTMVEEGKELPTLAEMIEEAECNQKRSLLSSLTRVAIMSGCAFGILWWLIEVA